MVTRKCAKCKATGISAVDGPPSKTICISLLKYPLHLHQGLQLLLVKCKVHTFFIVLMRNGSISLVAFKKINFACCNKMNRGSPCMPLTQPKQTHPIGGDGNCMFRSVSYVMTGSQEHHLEVCAKTLEHMETIAPKLLVISEVAQVLCASV